MKGLYTLINQLSKQGKMGNIIDFTVKVKTQRKMIIINLNIQITK